MIEVDGLRKVYPGGVEAVKGISFEVAAGEVFGLLGPNGAGKSTTIGMLTTTVRPTGGTAVLAGYDVVRQPLAARRRIAQIVVALGLAGLVDRPVGTYSGGERRRLEIARALVSQPRVLFLDEPTVGLDPRIRQELLDVIEELGAHTEMTILVTTHYLDEAERLCDRIAIMHAGRIVALDTPAALRAGLGRELIELHVDHDLTAALASLRAHGLAGEDAFAVGS